MINIKVPAVSHVVDNVEVERTKQPLNRAGVAPRRTDINDVHLRTERVNIAVTFSRYDMHFVPLLGQPSNKVRGPDLAAALAGIKRFEHNPDFQCIAFVCVWLGNLFEAEIIRDNF